MNKALLTLAVAALSLSASAQQTARVVAVSPSAVQHNSAQKVAKIASNQRWAGLYCTDNLAEYGMGVVNFPGDNKAAIYLSPDLMARYVGRKIVGMRVGLCYTINSTNFFIKSASGDVEQPSVGEDLCTESVASTSAGWNEITLTTPIEVTSGAGYFAGFDFKQKNTKSGQYYTEDCYPLSVVEEGDENPLWIYANISQAAGGNGPGWYGFGGSNGNLSIQLLVEGDYYDYDVTPSDFGQYTALINGTTNVKVNFFNLGAQTVRNLSYVVTMDGVRGEEQTVTLASPVTSNTSGSFKVAVQCPAEAKTNEVSIEVTKVNGQENKAANTVGKGSIVTITKSFKRGVVVEEFTGTGCGWCPRGLVGMEKLAQAYPDNFVGIGIHQYNTSDPMYTSNYASLGFSGAPQCMINRNGVGMDPYYGTNATILDDFAEALDELPMVGVNVYGVWNSDSTTVTVNTAIESFVSGSYNIAYVLVADDLSGKASSWRQGNYYYQYEQSQAPEDLQLFCRGGEKGTKTFQWDFDDVLIGSSYVGTTNQATPVTLTANGTTEASFEVAMPTKTVLKNAIDKKKVAVIAMVLDKQTGRVLNAAKSYNITSANAVKGVNNAASADAVEVARYNAAGQRIDAPVKGLNIVKMSDGRTQKVIVK